MLNLQPFRLIKYGGTFLDKESRGSVVYSIYMFWFQSTMLEPWEHDIIAILNLLDFHIVYCLVNRSLSFTRITLPPLPTIFLRNRFFDKQSAHRLVGGLHEPLLMHYWVQGCDSVRAKKTSFHLPSVSSLAVYAAKVRKKFENRRTILKNYSYIQIFIYDRKVFASLCIRAWWGR